MPESEKKPPLAKPVSSGKREITPRMFGVRGFKKDEMSEPINLAVLKHLGEAAEKKEEKFEAPIENWEDEIPEIHIEPEITEAEIAEETSASPFDARAAGIPAQETKPAKPQKAKQELEFGRAENEENLALAVLKAIEDKTTEKQEEIDFDENEIGPFRASGEKIRVVIPDYESQERLKNMTQIGLALVRAAAKEDEKTEKNDKD